MTKPMNSYKQRHNTVIRKITLEQANTIIDTRQPLGSFYVLEAGIYIGIDNSNGQAWMEEFPNLQKCKCWLSNPNVLALSMEKEGMW